MNRSSLSARLLLVTLLALLCACAPKKPGVLYQLAAFDSFAAGAYAGKVTLADLAAHGDFGLGTVDGLAGEMIVLDGKAWLADGRCRLAMADPAALSPFAALTFFRPALDVNLTPGQDMAAITAALDAALPPGTFAAVRITGSFKSLTIRSVPGYARPYPPLGEALKAQFVTQLQDASGTIVALRGPDKPAGVWVPGWHFHFVSADRTTGGHVLQVFTSEAKAQAMSMKRFELELP